MFRALARILLQLLTCKRRITHHRICVIVALCVAVVGFVHAIFNASNFSAWLITEEGRFLSGDWIDISFYYQQTQNQTNQPFESFDLRKSSTLLSDFLLSVENVTCFREGVIENNSTVSRMNGTCICKRDWHGPSCSIPNIVHTSKTPFNQTSLVLRNRPRKIIQAFPFNMEFEMLELRFLELKDVVDVYLILESNFSASGSAKELHLLNRLKAGMYPEVANKIVHVFLDYFPKGADKNGWITDGLHRNHLGSHGLPKISGWEWDDLFVMTDADELPCKEALQFLKWHDGYSEPIGAQLSWTAYGFFWRSGDGRGQAGYFAITMKLLHYVFRKEVYHIRSAYSFIRKRELELKIYLKMNGSIGPWIIGTEDLKCGWHCSWCMGPNRMQNKLLSAQNGDFPRWGDYPEKSNLTYIKSLVGRGMWFDNVSKMIASDPMDVPSGARMNNKFRHLIVNLYKGYPTNSTNGVTPTVARPSTGSKHR